MEQSNRPDVESFFSESLTGTDLLVQAQALYEEAASDLLECHASIRKHHDNLLAAERKLWKMEIVLDQLRRLLRRRSINNLGGLGFAEKPAPQPEQTHRYAGILLNALRNLARPVEWRELLQETRKQTNIDEVRLRERELGRLIREGKVLEQDGKYSLP